MKSDKLREFRQAAYKLLGKAHDATFELADAILTTRTAYSLAPNSLSPFFRRKWPSIYEALQNSRHSCTFAFKYAAYGQHHRNILARGVQESTVTNLNLMNRIHGSKQRQN